MTIIERNFFRLLRSGAFQKQEQVEPMSAYKWRQVYQLALIHDVAHEIYEGLKNCQNEFFLHLTDKQWLLWEKTLSKTKKMAQVEMEDQLRADYLTNPLLNRKLQDILDSEDSTINTRQILLMMIRCSKHLLNEGEPIRELVALGREIRQHSQDIDFVMLEKWTKDLNMQKVARLEVALLTELLGFEKKEIPFAGDTTDKHIEKIARELMKMSGTRSQQFYFSQDTESIFVHTSNGSAMLSHVRRSARYFRYFPSETVTNFFASFAHSLSHIEE